MPPGNRQCHRLLSGKDTHSKCDCKEKVLYSCLPGVSGGHAFSVFLTDRFCVKDVIGRTVIIHGGSDDFTSQPAGNAGPKIACGEIRRCTS